MAPPSSKNGATRGGSGGAPILNSDHVTGSQDDHHKMAAMARQREREKLKEELYKAKSKLDSGMAATRKSKAESNHG